jgi:hypothetical protein
MWQGGNQWSAWDGYLSFFEDVADLRLPVYEDYRHWRALSEHSGPRIIHPDFCMVSDRPEVLTVDAANLPHNDKGPFCRWRDGSALFAIHGVRVPAYVVEHPERITVQRIETEENAEVRRVMMERYGYERYILDSGAVMVQSDEFGTLYRKDFGPDEEPVLAVHVVNGTVETDGTRHKFVLPVHPECRPMLSGGAFGEPQSLTARNAVASTYGLRGEQYAPEIRT